MPLVFLTLNGVGLGHLSRTNRLGEAYAALGYGVTIFAQGEHLAVGPPRFPGKTIPRLTTASPSVRRTVARELSSLAEMSEPRVVLEDTHPSKLELSPRVRRVLVVSPTTFWFMRRLNHNYRQVYQSFLIADEPGSPLWPYTRAQSDEILSWSNWHVLGPVFRRPTAAEVAAIRERYRIDPDDPVCVVCMGGGGVQVGAAADRPRFIETTTAIANALRRIEPRTRILYVRGPLTPPDVILPSQFEVVTNETNVPALLAVARGAIIRPGDNASWECVSTGTPFVALRGTTFMEPVTRRLAQLERYGFAVRDLAEAWGPERHARRSLLQQIARRWSGEPDPSLLTRVVSAGARTRIFPAVAKPNPHRKTAPNLRLIARIDDVITLDANLRWLLGLLDAHALHSSLEVIPAQCRLVEADLDAIDRAGRVVVGQHGYDHVPAWFPHGRQSEFPFAAEAPSSDKRKLTDGRAALQRRFPTRLTGGLSAPFDSCPSWFGSAWQEMGGRFLSCMQVVPPAPRLPVLRFSIDLWDWEIDRARDVGSIVPQVRLANELRGYAGIVIHPWLLDRDGEAARLVELIEALAALGFRSTSVNELLGSAAG